MTHSPIKNSRLLKLRPLHVIALPLVLFCGLAERPVVAQIENAPSISGFPSQLPVVPQRGPRPSAPEQWQPGRDEASVPSFIETLKGNDAAFEVIVGQGQLLTTKHDIQSGQGTRLVAASDPTVIDFQILPNPRMIRIIGKRVGVSVLTITTADDQTYSFEVHVVYDIDLLRAQLRQVFPDARLRLAQLREHLIVEGQARSPTQVGQIIQMIDAYLVSVQVPKSEQSSQAAAGPSAQGSEQPPAGQEQEQDAEDAEQYGGQPEASAEAAPPSTKAAFAAPQVINLIRVPGVRQVMLQVRIAELNRTAMREIGADILGVDSSSGNILGTQIGGASVTAAGLLGLGGLTATAGGATDSLSTTAFGIFPSGDFEILIRALRKNSVLTLLAEPNLVTLSGHKASFLAGGQFPVPVPQVSGGVSSSVTVEFKDFGVQLDFVPYVGDDNVIRLHIESEVSTIDESLGTILVVGGTPVPGLNTRRTDTTVELRENQTLAIAGLLQVELDATTSRIPGLGDLPYIGPLFSNTSHERVEKELIVLVTPYLVSPMKPSEVPPLPGAEITDPNDLEFYLLNRIEGRTGRIFRAPTSWDNPLGLVEKMKLEQSCISCPVGFSE